jgi:hypothetical protein
MYLLLIDIYHLIENKIVNIYIYIYILNENIVNIYVFYIIIEICACYIT